MTRPVLGRPAPRRPAPQSVGPRSRARSVFEVQSQQPGNFSLHVQDRVRGVQLVLQAERLEPRARAPSNPAGNAFGRFRAAIVRGQLPQRALAPRLAPSRQMRAVQPLAAKQAAHLDGLCASIRLLQNPQPILCGELAPLRLGHSGMLGWTPRTTRWRGSTRLFRGKTSGRVSRRHGASRPRNGSRRQGVSPGTRW